MGGFELNFVLVFIVTVKNERERERRERTAKGKCKHNPTKTKIHKYAHIERDTHTEREQRAEREFTHTHTERERERERERAEQSRERELPDITFADPYSPFAKWICVRPILFKPPSLINGQNRWYVLYHEIIIIRSHKKNTELTSKKKLVFLTNPCTTTE